MNLIVAKNYHGININIITIKFYYQQKPAILLPAIFDVAIVEKWQQFMTVEQQLIAFEKNPKTKVMIDDHAWSSKNQIVSKNYWDWHWNYLPVFEIASENY